MKTFYKLAALVLGTLGSALAANAQATATATSSATIVSPIAIAKVADMNFGNIGIDENNAGVVTLSAGGDRSKSGGVSLPATSGTVAAASFEVTGQPNYTYAITLPNSLVIASGDNTMIVNAFTSSPAATGTLSAAGAQTVNVGASLNVGAGQAEGTYTSTTPFEVTVNYN